MATKAAARAAYRCTECGQTAARWVGRCPECQAWGSVSEVGATVVRAVRPGPVSAPALPIADVDAAAAAVRPTGVPELDRVLGGGLVPGAVCLLAGEPGVGKSTLLLEVAHQWASAAPAPSRVAASPAPSSSVAASTSRGGPHRALIVSGEESTSQIRLRAGRTAALSPHLYLAAENDLAALLGHVDAIAPTLLVVDSIQTITHPEVDGSAGSVTQVRECAAALIRVAKERGIATLLVGHVTKDGAIAGPRVLEHLVDVVLHFEGDRHASLRMIRAVKNRFGPADEVGCFELGDAGITGLPDPSGLFLSDRAEPVPGTCVTISLEGKRPLVAEVQALAVPTTAGYPRRTASGLDSNRLAMLLAVLERRAGTVLKDYDVYASTVGGVRLQEPAADLALALALAGAKTNLAGPAGVVAIGEVGLAGDVRRVNGVGRRLAEAARLGFTRALVPAGSGASAPAGLTVTEVDTLGRALAAAR